MEYRIRPIGKKCAGTGDTLPPGARCLSVLVDQQGEQVRLDFAEEAWAGPPEGTIGYWRSQVPEAVADDKPRPIDPDALMRYFEQLEEHGNTMQEQLRYVLALLLLQRRRLQLEGSREDGDVEYLQLSGTRGEGNFEVRDHELAAEELEALQQQLTAHLQSEQEEEWE